MFRLKKSSSGQAKNHEVLYNMAERICDTQMTHNVCCDSYRVHNVICIYCTIILGSSILYNVTYMYYTTVPILGSSTLTCAISWDRCSLIVSIYLAYKNGIFDVSHINNLIDCVLYLVQYISFMYLGTLICTDDVTHGYLKHFAVLMYVVHFKSSAHCTFSL